MKHPYLPALALLLGLGSARPAAAQYAFTDANLGPYTQNFNTMSGNVTFSAGSATQPSLIGLYAEAQYDPQFGGSSGSPGMVAANDGATVTGNYYHFGYANDADRAFGGVAEVGTPTGNGFVGIRLKNNATVVIQNLEVQYTMEQWYNSGNAAAAFVNVSYRKSSGVAGENFATLSNGAVGNAWTAVPALTVQAPSTGTAITSRDGNSPANRRVAQTILTGLNLAPGEEVMMRWDYVLNQSTNGNGVSIDDVVMTPQTGVSMAQGGPGMTWTNPPTDPTAANRTYYLAGTVSATDLAGISGTNSKIIVGTPALNGNPAQPGTLVLSDNTALLVPVDVAGGSTLRIEEGAAGAPLTLGLLAPTSNVVYAAAAAPQTIKPASYGRLTLEGAGAKTLGGNVLVNDNLLLSGAKLQLGSFNATVTKGGSVLGADATSYVVTDNAGRLRQSVLADNAEVVFPVGTSAAYLPLTLRQTATRSEDVFAVRATNDKYADYDANDNGIGAPVAKPQSVQKTWLVSEEVPGNASVTMKTQWTAAEQSGDFNTARAYISHYRRGLWDRTATEVGATLVPATTDVYTMSRSNITSFSPFTVSSDLSQPLPVELISFAARRADGAVYCTWTTASEKNNHYFALERSLNGQRFGEIGTLPGAGTSSAARTYALADRSPAAGTAYYRLRQVDKDGKADFSPVVTVKGAAFAAALAVTVAPNPSAGPVAVTVSTDEATTVQGTVRNVLGAVVQRFAQPVSAGAQAILLDLSGQPAGVYLLQVQSPQGIENLRVIKQ